MESTEEVSVSPRRRAIPCERFEYGPSLCNPIQTGSARECWQTGQRSGMVSEEPQRSAPQLARGRHEPANCRAEWSDSSVSTSESEPQPVLNKSRMARSRAGRLRTRSSQKRPERPYRRQCHYRAMAIAAQRPITNPFHNGRDLLHQTAHGRVPQPGACPPEPALRLDLSRTETNPPVCRRTPNSPEKFCYDPVAQKRRNLGYGISPLHSAPARPRFLDGEQPRI